MKRNNTIGAFFELLKAGLWEVDACLSSFEAIDYNTISQLAQEQSVEGIITAGFEHVKDVEYPQAITLEFVGSALQIERYRLRLCEADMKQLVGLPQQSNYYGERCQFLHGYQKSGDLSCLKSLVYYLAIYNIRSMSRPQNWSKMIQNTMFMAHTDTAILSTKNHISQTASVNVQCARQWRVVPLEQA